MICEQCKRHVAREIAARKGARVNCLAYGCDKVCENGYYCQINDIINYTIERMIEDKNFAVNVK